MTRTPDPDARRFLFVAAGLFVLLAVAGVALGVTTGSWGLLGGVVFLFGSTTVLFVSVVVLYWLASRLFPARPAGDSAAESDRLRGELRFIADRSAATAAELPRDHPAAVVLRAVADRAAHAVRSR